MTEEEKKLLKRYDITVGQKSVYFYKGYEYEHFKDAVNYARIEFGRRHAPGEPST